MATTMPAQYFNRHDPSKEYEEHLFIAGRGLQSAELNELQKQSNYRLRGIADALFKDGNIIRDASVQVDQTTGVVTCQSGAVYIAGSVRGVPPATFTIPLVGTVAIGVYLTESVVTSLEDPSLKDPASGTRNYDEPGADRLRLHSAWGWDGDGELGDFFPVYSVQDGVLAAKEPPPTIDPIVQSMARYDRDSAGGTYIVSGLQLKALEDDGATQVYSLAEGRARVFGYGVEFTASRRLRLTTTPDLRHVANEPHLSTTAASHRVLFDRPPAANLSQVSITGEKTVTLTHGVFSGAQDQLPDTSVLALLEVKQGATTYAATTDYLLTAGRVDWSPGGAEPSPGSTYTVKYQYITLVTPTAVDDYGFSVAGAVTGTLILATYDQKLPRYDRLCINPEGQTLWLQGVASDTNPQLPTIPSGLLGVAAVYQTWTDDREIVNDGVRTVTMPTLSRIDSRLDLIMQLIAQNRLESDIHTREAGSKKGLFTDPFIDDTQRDSGIAQTAAVVRGELLLPISAAVHQMSADIQRPITLQYTNVVTLEQTLRTGGMAINPYMSFALVPARVTLVPDVDRWTVVETEWTSPSTERFTPLVSWAARSSRATPTTTTTRNVLLSSTQSNIETLRQIPVQFTIAGFGPGEALSSLTFDGLTIPVAGVVANASGVAVGSFTIPAGIPSGTKAVRVVGAGGMTGLASFTGQGTLERQVWQQQTTIVQSWQSPPAATNQGSGGRVPVFGPARVAAVTGDAGGGDGGGGCDADPLAQTFILTSSAMISGVDIWFTAAPTTECRIQIRETTSSAPNLSVLIETVVPPASIVTGGAATRITFPGPQMLQANVEYAIVVLCNDSVGAISVAELGKFDQAAQRWITSQPYTVGVLFSSSNARTWTPHQDRDMAFRILTANFTQTERIVPLGQAAVTNATDLMLMAFADRPANQTFVEYNLTLPDASVITVEDGQAVQLPAAITGNVQVSAKLQGTASFSPMLTPGTQLVAGTVAATADYVTRAIPGGASVTIKVIYEANVPSGASVVAQYKGDDAGDAWTTIPSPTTRPADDGFVEFTHTVTGVNEALVRTKLVLNGTSAARPRVRDLRVIVM